MAERDLRCCVDTGDGAIGGMKLRMTTLAVMAILALGIAVTPAWIALMGWGLYGLLEWVLR